MIAHVSLRNETTHYKMQQGYVSEQAGNMAGKRQAAVARRACI